MNKRGTAVAAGAIIIVGVVGGSILSNQREPVRRRSIPQRQGSVEIVSVQIGDLRSTVTITGEKSKVEEAVRVIERLVLLAKAGRAVDESDVLYALGHDSRPEDESPGPADFGGRTIRVEKGAVRPKSAANVTEWRGFTTSRIGESGCKTAYPTVPAIPWRIVGTCARSPKTASCLHKFSRVWNKTRCFSPIVFGQMA